MSETESTPETTLEIDGDGKLGKALDLYREIQSDRERLFRNTDNDIDPLVFVSSIIQRREMSQKSRIEKLENPDNGGKKNEPNLEEKASKSEEKELFDSILELIKKEDRLEAMLDEIEEGKRNLNF